MKREIEFQNEQLGVAISDVFKDRPPCGALGTFDDISRRRIINEMIDTVSQLDSPVLEEMEASRKRVRLLTVAAAAGFFLMFVLGGMLWFHLEKTVVPNQETYFGEVQALDGHLLIGGTQASMHAPIPVGKTIQTQEGTATLRLPTGIEWWMSEKSVAEITTLNEQTLQAAVHAGEIWFRVDPMRRGPAFSVETQSGRIDVTGTIFVVSVQPSNTQVTLLRGEVWFTQDSGKEKMTTGNSLLLGQGEKQVALTTAQARQYQEQLAALSWNGEEGVDVAASDVTNSSLPDGGKTSTSMGSGGERAVSPSPVGNGMIKSVSYDELLDEIYVQRKKRNWKRVEFLYKRLFRIAPGRETAVISRVTLGEIYLTKLHRYKDALAQFNKYIRSGHSALLPEAVYGKCNAFKSLGKKEQEQRCLSGFIEQFDTALQISEAKARFAFLRAE